MLVLTLLFCLGFLLLALSPAFVSGRLRPSLARRLILAGVIFAPLILLCVVLLVAPAASGEKDLVVFLALMPLLALAWYVAALVGFDLGRRTSQDYLENRYR